MASRNKILKQADRLAARGNYANAAETLLKLVEENPRDVTLLNKAGDLYVRAGLVDDAVQQFESIATFFKDDGFLLKAIAIYKKISKLDPSRTETYLELGQLYAERGLQSEAKENLKRAAEGFGRSGQDEAARKALEQLEKLDPDDSAVRGRLVEMAEEGGDTDEAASRHLESATRLLDLDKRDDALESLEKALSAGSSQPSLLAGMGRLLVKAGKPARAVKLLDEALAGIEEPELEYLLVLGRAKREAGDPDGAKAHLDQALKLDYGNDRCHVEKAYCYLAASDSDRAFEQCRHVFNRSAESKSNELCLTFLERFLEQDPLHLFALRELALVQRALGDDETHLQTLSRLAGACHQAGCYREELLVLKRLAGEATGDAATVLETRRQEAEVAAADQTGALDEALVDFLMQEDEEHLPAEEAVEEPAAGETPFGPPPALAANGSDRVVLGEEERAEAGEKEIELIIEDEQPEVPAADDGDAVTVEVSEDQPPASEAEIKDLLDATRVFLSYGMLNKALGQVEELLDRFPGRVDVCQLAAKIYTVHSRDDDAEAMNARIAELGEGTDAAAGDDIARAAWMSAGEDETPAAPAPTAPVEEPTAAPAAEDQAPLGEELEEIDFFISQGFDAEARDLIQGLLKAHPGHTRLISLLEQVGGSELEAEPTAPASAEPETVPPVAPAKPEPPPPAESPLDDGQLSEVFTMFQAEVADQVDDEDFGTHYDLGIAYKEMMLVDEAIGEFQIAVRSEEKRLDCCCMLGACFMEKGMPGEAIKWYEKGIVTAETGSQESRGLQYDLAAALEANGSTEKALEVFQALASVDGEYRDVAARIERLKSS